MDRPERVWIDPEDDWTYEKVTDGQVAYIRSDIIAAEREKREEQDQRVREIFAWTEEHAGSLPAKLSEILTSCEVPPCSSCAEKDREIEALKARIGRIAVTFEHYANRGNRNDYENMCALLRNEVEPIDTAEINVVADDNGRPMLVVDLPDGTAIGSTVNAVILPANSEDTRKPASSEPCNDGMQGGEVSSSGGGAE